MRSLTIARNTFMQALHLPVLHVIVVGSVLLLALVGQMPQFTLVVEDDIKMLKDLAVATASLCGMLVALFADRAAPLVHGRLALGAAQAAVADRFGRRTEPGRVADLQGPGQRRHLADGRDRHQPLHALGQQRVLAQPRRQPSLSVAKHFHRLAAQPHQIPH